MYLNKHHTELTCLDLRYSINIGMGESYSYVSNTIINNKLLFCIPTSVNLLFPTPEFTGDTGHCPPIISLLLFPCSSAGKNMTSMQYILSLTENLRVLLSLFYFQRKLGPLQIFLRYWKPLNENKSQLRA